MPRTSSPRRSSRRFRSARGYRGTGPVKAWLVGIARRKAADARRQSRPHVGLEEARQLIDPVRTDDVSRVFAGVFSIGLAYLATWALGLDRWALALVVGLLAVPLAPIAKDLASSLQAAAAAMRAAK